jgi:hypothetical protein
MVPPGTDISQYTATKFVAITRVAAPSISG